jgi:hypothetical protein
MYRFDYEKPSSLEAASAAVARGGPSPGRGADASCLNEAAAHAA